ncbi:MAG TPA: sulfatase-like hydrolase/transferase [bacterium]|jgi:hypothetical protein
MNLYVKISILVGILLLIGGGYLYSQSSRDWQDSYRSRVSSELVTLIQDNQFDTHAVVIVVIDGLRYTEGIGGGDEYIPFIYNELVPRGCLFTNYRIESPTVTTSSHSSMLTGRTTEVPNDGHIRPVFPTFFEQYRDARSEYLAGEIASITDPGGGIFRPDAGTREEIDYLVSRSLEFDSMKTPMFLGKDLISNLNQSSSGRYPDSQIFLADSMRDIEVTDLFRAKLPDVRPTMVLVNLADTDESAHEAVWQYYADAIRQADRWVEEIWNALQAETRYRDNTYFILTTDHGRHSPDRGGFSHHGDFCESCQHSFLLVIGPGIKQGEVFDTRYTELDVAPTVAAMMGFEMPASNGEVIDEIFESPEDLPVPIPTVADDLVLHDKEVVDNRDTAGELRNVVSGHLSDSRLDFSFTQLFEILTLCEAGENDPESVSQPLSKIAASIIAELANDDKSRTFDYIHYIYPMLTTSKTLAEVDPPVSSELTQLATSMARNNSEWIGTYWEEDFEKAMLGDIGLAAAGKLTDDSELTRSALGSVLSMLASFEGTGKAFDESFEDCIDDWRYREGPSVLFTDIDPTMHQKMLLLWSLERILAECDPTHSPELYQLVRRQYRLMCAFTHEWQDANAVVGGTGEFSDKIDFLAQGLCLASFAEFKPWRKWELDGLGYSEDIYITPLFDFPFQHMFYLLGQANALAGCWAANERLQLCVNDDLSINPDFLYSGQTLRSGSDEYYEAVAGLAYGLTRFEKADYQMFDLELYPLIHQLYSE